MRLFFALEVPPELVTTLREVRVSGTRGWKWTKPELYHLTLRFVGECELAEVAKLQRIAAAAAKQHSTFELVCEGLGQFSNRILWAGLRESKSLRSLCSALGAQPDHPHVTLARRKRGDSGKLELPPKKLYGAWTVDSFVLMESELTPQGPIYSIRDRWRLRG